jgi:hypothetical protein
MYKYFFVAFSSFTIRSGDFIAYTASHYIYNKNSIGFASCMHFFKWYRKYRLVFTFLSFIYQTILLNAVFLDLLRTFLMLYNIYFGWIIFISCCFIELMKIFWLNHLYIVSLYRINENIRDSAYYENKKISFVVHSKYITGKNQVHI